jgi:hypothetical protein
VATTRYRKWGCKEKKLKKRKSIREKRRKNVKISNRRMRNTEGR